MSRAVRNKVAPVAFSALAVSIPMPDVDPVMTIILLEVVLLGTRRGLFGGRLVERLRRLGDWNEQQFKSLL